MKIVLLDRESIGFDTPIESLYTIGEVEIYDRSTHKEAIERAKDADVIIINKVRIDHEVIENAKNLKLICVFATGFDNIDITSAKKHNVAVSNVPGYSTESVTACTIANVLALSTNIREYNQYVVNGEYSESGKPNLLTPVFHEISNKVWGIIGCGDIGSAIARVATALGAKVVTYQRHKHPIYETLDLEQLCSQSDIITIHCPLNDESRGLINKNLLEKMKSSVIIVNAARGAVLDEAAVAESIKSKQIGAFGCDVYSTEPFGLDHPFYEIKSYPNVLLTPHCAWGSFESRERCINIIHNNIISFLNGKISNRVDI